MNDERFERLLKGYALPDVSPDLDRRVLREGSAVLARAQTMVTLEAIGHSVLHSLGFGYVAWLTDLITTTDAEYRVDLI